MAAFLGALAVIGIEALAGVLYLAHRLGRLERTLQSVLRDYDITLQAIKDSLAELDERVSSVNEMVDAIEHSPLVQSLLARPAQEESSNG